MAVVQKLQGLRSLLCDCFVTCNHNVFCLVRSLDEGLLGALFEARDSPKVCCCLLSLLVWKVLADSLYSTTLKLEVCCSLTNRNQKVPRVLCRLLFLCLPRQVHRGVKFQFQMWGTVFSMQELAMPSCLKRDLELNSSRISVFSEVVKVYKKLFELARIEQQ